MKETLWELQCSLKMAAVHPHVSESWPAAVTKLKQDKPPASKR